VIAGPIDIDQPLSVSVALVVDRPEDVIIRKMQSYSEGHSEAVARPKRLHLLNTTRIVPSAGASVSTCVKD